MTRYGHAVIHFVLVSPVLPLIRERNLPVASNLLTSQAQRIFLDLSKSRLPSYCSPLSRHGVELPFQERLNSVEEHARVSIVVWTNLARILYSKNSKVYLACSSGENATNSITNIRTAVPRSSSQLVFLYLDLADLIKVAAAAQRFLAQESILHFLFNDAGVMIGPADFPLKTVYGISSPEHELRRYLPLHKGPYAQADCCDRVRAT